MDAGSSHDLNESTKNHIGGKQCSCASDHKFGIGLMLNLSEQPLFLHFVMCGIEWAYLSGNNTRRKTKNLSASKLREILEYRDIVIKRLIYCC